MPAQQKPQILDQLLDNLIDRIMNTLTASVNPTGESCPMALRLIACVLLLEITTFMRETYKSLPKMHRALAQSQNTNPPISSFQARASNCWSSSILANNDQSGMTVTRTVSGQSNAAGGGHLAAPEASRANNSASSRYCLRWVLNRFTEQFDTQFTEHLGFKL